MSADEQKMLDNILAFRDRIMDMPRSGRLHIFKQSPQAHFILSNKKIIGSLGIGVLYENSSNLSIDIVIYDKQHPLILDIIFQDHQVDLKTKFIEMQLRGMDVIYPTEEQIEAWSKPFKL